MNALQRLLKLLPLLLAFAPAGRAAHWPQFRGPDGAAVAADAHPPVHFSPDSNVWWKAELPAGHSSPCVWGDSIFLTAQSGKALETICLDARSGSVRWRRPAPAESIEPAHRIANAAAPTPVTDGQRVFIYFGSFGFLAYDFDGREQWRRALPPPVVEFGTSPSPILAGDRLIVVCDQDLNSFLLAVRPRDGSTLLAHGARGISP
jgi:outer membrane protein assembly factor BamB